MTTTQIDLGIDAGFLKDQNIVEYRLVQQKD